MMLLCYVRAVAAWDFLQKLDDGSWYYGRMTFTYKWWTVVKLMMGWSFGKPFDLYFFLIFYLGAVRFFSWCLTVNCLEVATNPGNIPSKEEDASWEYIPDQAVQQPETKDGGSSKVSRLEIVIRVKQNFVWRNLAVIIFLSAICFFSIGRYFWNEIQVKKLSNFRFGFCINDCDDDGIIRFFTNIFQWIVWI